MVGVNPFELSAATLETIRQAGNHTNVIRRGSIVSNDPASYLEVSDLFSAGEIAALVAEIQGQTWQAVGLDGFADKPVEQVGNYRLSTFNEEVASILWQRLSPMFAARQMVPETPTDHDNYPGWRPVGVSPLFRFIRYLEGGQLVAHYDATYKESDTRRTLMSLVIYLTTNEHGATRFLIDPQAGKRMDEMDFADWERAGNDDEVNIRIPPVAGHAIAFDHRILHDGEPLGEGDPEKIIIRTDIMFEQF